MIFLIFFITSGKCFPSKIKVKHFPGNQTKIIFLLKNVFNLSTFLMINNHKKINFFLKMYISFLFHFYFSISIRDLSFIVTIYYLITHSSTFNF